MVGSVWGGVEVFFSLPTVLKLARSLLLPCSGLHRPVYLLSKPGPAAIVDYAVSTHLTFDNSSSSSGGGGSSGGSSGSSSAAGAGGGLAAARLQLQVDLEVAAAAAAASGGGGSELLPQQQQQQQLAVTVDVCLSDGSVLLGEVPAVLEEVSVRE